MKAAPSPLLVCVGIFLAIPILALADTVTLKSGEVIEGKILSETDQQIVMDAVVSAGIIDQKTIARGEVQTVSKTPPDEIAYQAIKGCQIEPRSLPTASYAPMVKSLETFLQKYPQSSRAGEVQGKLAAFKQEQEKVQAGNIKWNNRWYTPAEIEKNKYQLRAQMQLATMRDQATRRDYIGALNSFDQLEKTYPGSEAYLDGIELAKSILRLAASDMDRAMTAFRNQEMQFTNGIVLVPEPQKSQMIAARQAQIAAAEAALAAAERAGVKWKPFQPMASKGAESLKTALAAETPRLEALPLAAMRASLAKTKEAEAALKESKIAEAQGKIKEAQTLWAQNNQAVVLGAEIESLKKKVAPVSAPPVATTGHKSAAPKPVEATPTPAPTPTPTPTPKAKGWFDFF